MNILPKKRWHVRTKDNIARVRRDEAQAAEEEKERERRIKLAEKEARRDFMRERTRASQGNQEYVKPQDFEEDRVRPEQGAGHVNFFAEEEAGLASSTAVNKEHEEEKKQEKEKYEKQIGYLTYLGQDTNESTGKVSWYNKCPEREELGLSPTEEMGLKHKVMADPLFSFQKYCSSNFTKTSSMSSTSKQLTPESSNSGILKRKRSKTPEKSSKDKSHRDKKKKRKKHKKEKKYKSRPLTSTKSEKGYDSSDSNDKESLCSEDEVEKKVMLEKLRAERLRREREEKKKAEKLMAKMNGVTYIDEDEMPHPKPVMKQRYNSQFNPDLAKQNYDDQRYRF